MFKAKIGKRGLLLVPAIAILTVVAISRQSPQYKPFAQADTWPKFNMVFVDYGIGLGKGGGMGYQRTKLTWNGINDYRTEIIFHSANSDAIGTWSEYKRVRNQVEARRFNSLTKQVETFKKDIGDRALDVLTPYFNPLYIQNVRAHVGVNANAKVIDKNPLGDAEFRRTPIPQTDTNTEINERLNLTASEVSAKLGIPLNRLSISQSSACLSKDIETHREVAGVGPCNGQRLEEQQVLYTSENEIPVQIVDSIDGLAVGGFYVENLELLK